MRNAGKSHFGPNLGLLDPNLGHNPVQYLGELRMQTWEYSEKSNFGPSFWLPKFFGKFYLYL